MLIKSALKVLKHCIQHGNNTYFYATGFTIYNTLVGGL